MIVEYNRYEKGFHLLSHLDVLKSTQFSPFRSRILLISRPQKSLCVPGCNVLGTNLYDESNSVWLSLLLRKPIQPDKTLAPQALERTVDNQSAYQITASIIRRTKKTSPHFLFSNLPPSSHCCSKSPSSPFPFSRHVSRAHLHPSLRAQLEKSTFSLPASFSVFHKHRYQAMN